MPPPPPFPFLRLPFLIQPVVLENASILELFYFSLISKRCKSLVLSLKLTLSRLHWHFFSNSHYQLKLKHWNGTEISLSFKTYPENVRPSEKIAFNGSVLSVKRERTMLYICNMSGTENLTMMEQFTKFFLELFKVSKWHLTWTSDADLSDCFVWKYTKIFETVRIIDKLSPREMKYGNVRFILKELTINNKLDLWSIVRGSFDYYGKLKMRSINIVNGSWLILKSVLRMDCEYVRFHHTTFNVKDLNMILKKWINGDLNKLKRFELSLVPFKSLSEHLRGIFLDDATDGIATFPWDIRNRPRRTSEYNFQNGRDIRRRDGTIATVDYNKVNRKDIFVFHVWDKLSIEPP